MSKQTKTTTQEEAKPVIVPKLRFPEFQEAEGWAQSVLVAACNMQAGKFVSASNISDRNEGGLFPCYGGNGLRGYTRTHTHNGTYPLIGRQGALCGNVRLVSGQFHATEHAVVATPKNNIDVGWLYYSLDLLNLNRFATGQAQPGLSVDVLENVALAIPPLEEEQQRIAACLSSLDDLINAQSQQITSLKNHKKGLMQQLFPREGESVPRMRFPEFRENGEWEKKCLSKEVQLISGMHLSPDQYSTTGEVPYFTGPSDFTNDIDSFTKWTNRSANMAEPNDTLITVKGSGVGEVWYSTIKSVALGRQLMAVRAKQGSSQFIFQFLLTKKTRFEDLGSGNLIPGLSRTDILDMEVHFPSSTEQQRIAACLSSLDDLITAQAAYLDTLKQHKKGLMQQLFPTAEQIEA
jgi:type I restriction enzyme S subunit